MADIKYLAGVKVGGAKDGSAVVLAGSTETEGIFTIAIRTKEVGQIVCGLLKMLARPEFVAHAPAKQPVPVGGSLEARLFRVEAISVAKVALLPGTALCVDFPGAERIAIGLPLDESDLLSQQLQEAVRSLRSSGSPKRN